MIEQIINWYGNLSFADTCLLIFLISPLIVCILVTIYFEVVKDKRKTTTQKYKEGLIKK